MAVAEHIKPQEFVMKQDITADLLVVDHLIHIQDHQHHHQQKVQSDLLLLHSLRE